MSGERKKSSLRTENLAVGYDGHVVLDGVEISVQRGEILAFIGPNGAGKSTVLKSLVRGIAPIRGTVLLNENPMQEMSGNEIARKMSVLMTGKMDAELMTCGDVVCTGRYPYTGVLGILSDADKKAAKEAMEAVHVLHLQNRSFHQISDGQRQRVLLARAICQEPEVLILDEPTSYLDIRYKLELLHLLKKLVEERNLAVVLSMHELELVGRIADRLVCVKDGKVDRTGIPEEVFRGKYIKELYGIEGEEYDSLLASLGLISR